MHSRIERFIAEVHINELSTLSPPVTISSPYFTLPSPPGHAATPSTILDDLDTADEIALRSLLLGIIHRTAGSYVVARSFLSDAYQRQPDLEVNTWIGSTAMFELAVLDLKECESEEAGHDHTTRWENALRSAREKLDKSSSLSTSSTDFSNRLYSRIAMLGVEIATKLTMISKPNAR